ncbi:Alpha-tocopherol transfer protein-like protein [Trachymyrmex septentrionalis]|uniref:Alpha-tocopherol transfer protein-like protein n=1 Tax=Trachymyrmex septentrionalis TaxID=34720 RepID=A0A195F0M1_9HYME|nr:PREDICTED: clavesin-2-like [Trachymyrmex septentrionalis]XP_018349901.1 PREDICTED: clavesin-2-like [Trachymyrmex septentrionalis]XP_018349902.1 PREDICTED: clavesin-2-like [Trachymyrmex septentrionalis]KYN34130.1 Alpha-tocopherol transfer protein-like protein [Trachymyrmex septentrionalis]
MGAADEDNYECPLSMETQKIAKEELREDKNTRDQALEQMRNWIKMNPRIQNCRLDAQFLLRFLRCKKFNVPMAQEAIERYLLLRQVYQQAFHKLDITEPNMEELLSLGYLFAVPGRDAKGRRIIIARPGVFDPHKYTNVDMCKIHAITYETLMEDEESQVRGYVHFTDGAGVSFPHLTLFTPKEAVRIVKNGERTVPMRHKEVYGINSHPSVKFALDFGMSLISEKIRNRVKIYTSLEDAINHKLDVTMLPKEYGGTIPMKEMIDLWRKELLAIKPTLQNNDKMSVCLELYSEKAREGAVSALKQGFGCSSVGSNDTTMCGISGSFRKLEVD